MKIVLAKTAGFCFGVQKAVDCLEEELERANKENIPLYTWGPIIHNQEVIRSFEEQGVTVLENEADLEGVNGGCVVIRAHGVSPEVYDLLERHHLRIVDGTCPFVKRIHERVRQESEEGKAILITGNPAHPEVQGIIGWCKNKEATVLHTREDVESYRAPQGQEISLVSQTTFHLKKFKEFVEIAKKKSYYDINVFNTICNATEQRQTESREIASFCDAMLVIGDEKSSNTQRLFEICKAQCKHTYLVQTAKDLDPTWFTDIESLGITAGASTPNNIIEEVFVTCQKCQT